MRETKQTVIVQFYVHFRFEHTVLYMELVAMLYVKDVSTNLTIDFFNFRHSYILFLFQLKPFVMRRESTEKSPPLSKPREF